MKMEREGEKNKGVREREREGEREGGEREMLGQVQAVRIQGGE